MEPTVTMTEHQACYCETWRQQTDARVTQWRTLCQQFFYKQDPSAKRFLEYFESDKLDQIIIETESDAAATDEAKFTQMVTFLGLRRCLVPTHDAMFNDTIVLFERIKNEVRGGYHRYIADKKYTAFDAHVVQQQGTNYLHAANPRDGTALHDRLVMRIHARYERTLAAKGHVQQQTQAFIKEHLHQIGSHPFLLGLRRMLEWNLASSTVVAWQLSDAVFVESGGDAFTSAAVHLLVHVLNCSHILSHDTPTPPSVKRRIWLIDPFLSDPDLQALLKLFPSCDKLQGRATGDKHSTEIVRQNITGQFDEQEPFLQRWCAIL